MPAYQLKMSLTSNSSVEILTASPPVLLAEALLRLARYARPQEVHHSSAFIDLRLLYHLHQSVTASKEPRVQAFDLTSDSIRRDFSQWMSASDYLEIKGWIGVDLGGLRSRWAEHDLHQDESKKGKRKQPKTFELQDELDAINYFSQFFQVRFAALPGLSTG
jgi:hypothetical protein